MTEKHIHDCTGPEMTCSCGYSTDTRRKAADIIEDIVSCADECDGGGSDAEDYAKELYAVAFAAGQRSIQAGEAIPVSPTKHEVPNCRWCIDDKGGDSVYETSCGHNFYFDDASGAGENEFRFCAYCGGKLVEVRTSEDTV